MITLKRLLHEEKIDVGSKVFIVTDNSVSKSIFFKGLSKLSTLHEMIVELQKLEMERELIVCFVWISGKRMIKLGVDGLSLGDCGSGVMAGSKLLEYLHSNETSLE